MTPTTTITRPSVHSSEAKMLETMPRTSLIRIQPTMNRTTTAKALTRNPVPEDDFSVRDEPSMPPRVQPGAGGPRRPPGAAAGAVVDALEGGGAGGPVAALELEAGEPVAAHGGAMAALAGALGLGKQEEAAG